MSGIPLNHTEWSIGDVGLDSAMGRARGAWRRRVVVEGLVFALVAILVSLLAFVLAAAWLRVTPATLGVMRLCFGLFSAAAIGWWVVRPSFRRVTQAEMARYLEENEPEFGQLVMSAVGQVALPVDQRSSPALVQRLTSQATSALDAHGDGRALEWPRLRRALLLLVGVSGAAVMVLGFGPSSWRTLAGGFLMPWAPNEEIVPARTLVVNPGDITLPRGASLDLQVRAHGFLASEALLYTRRDGDSEWDVMPMVAEAGGTFTLRLFDLDSSFAYQVRAEAVESAVHRVTVTELPAVNRVDLRLDYPAYVGLPTDTIVDGGDVAAVVGTVVEVRPTLTMPVRGGMLRFDDGTRIPLAITDSLAPMARFRVQRNGFYSIDLVAPDGTEVPGTVRWAVDALEDRPPVVRILEPGRDTRATNVEEVAIAAGADDDYGVRSLALRYSVNGAAEQAIELGNAFAPGTLTPRVAHTLFLEEMPLSAGDLVSYYAIAVDGAGNEARSDLYFVEIRPFSRNYRQAEEGGAPMPGGMPGGEQQPELSRGQRELIVATFNVLRDSSSTSAQRVTEDIAAVAVGQERLLDRVRGLATEMVTRGAAAVDSTFVDVKQALDSAATAMDSALTELRANRLTQALPMEQRALQQVQRAEALYSDVQVQMGQQQGGGGGGGGGGGAPEDLADLFDLERDQLRNQYEAVQRQSGAAPEAAREVDEAGERLRDLARRLEQENERQRRMAEAMSERLGQSGAAGSAASDGGAASGRESSGRASSGGSAAQRRFAAEAEEEARRLERLARERNTPELAQAAQAAREAADALRRAAAGEAGREEQAVESLRGAAEGVSAGQESRARRESERLGQDAAELAREQRRVNREAASLPPRGSANREATVRRLQQDGARLSSQAAELQQELDQLSRELRGSDPSAAGALGEGAQRMREFQIPERIEQGSRYVGDDRINPQSLERYNEQIAQVLEEVRDRVAQAAGAVGSSPARQQSRALERARELVRGMDAMRERSEAAGERGQAQGEGQQGQAQGEGQQAASPAGTPGGQAPAGGDSRQLSREVQMRLGAAQELRSELRDQGITVSPLDEAIATMRRLQQDRVLGDPLDRARLQAEALESLRQAEFELWRRFGGGSEGLPAVGELSRVSPRYRALVEEYFRSIARDRP